MKRLAFWLEPLDTLFFRDGRPFSATSKAASGLPTPQTWAGALRTWFLKHLNCDFEHLKESLQNLDFEQALSQQDLGDVARIALAGPWLARREQNDFQIFFTVPASLRRVKETSEIMMLRPQPPETLPGWHPPIDGLWPLWLPDKAEVELTNGFLSLEGLKKFLKGQPPDSTNIIPVTDLMVWEDRVGIGIDSKSQRAAEGLIYAIRMLRLQSGVGFYAEATIPDPLLPLMDKLHSLPFGGEGRRVQVHRVEPVELPSDPGQGAFQTMTLLTPAPILEPAWQQRWQICTAAQQPYLAISGWDLARQGPKPMRFALPSGTVLYFSPEQPLPDRLVSAEDYQLGWGHYLKGAI